MKFVLTTQAVNGARYYHAGNGELCVQPRNAQCFADEREARELCSAYTMRQLFPARDPFGTRLRGFKVVVQ